MFTKSLVRFGLIGALVAGAGLAVAGPDRLSALWQQTRNVINGQIDKAIEDPVALRQQLKSLEGEYPTRIADVRGDLAELKTQVAQLNRDLTVSHRVAELAASDLDTLHDMIGRAETAQTEAGTRLTSATLSDGTPLVDAAPAAVVRINFGNETLTLDQAYAKAQRIQQVQSAYAQRGVDIERDLGYLAQQEQRLTQVLGQLEQEHTEFQAQMWQLDRQVDSISRNQRLIDVMAKRQASIEEHGRYRATSLDQVQARFAEIRAKQEAMLDTMGKGQTSTNYEDRAKIDLDAKMRDQAGAKARENRGTLPPPKPTVIEINPRNDRAPSQSEQPLPKATPTRT
ncbi:MAG: hypothetical protein SFY96_12930 [Planctomycetota bacterium]|nr:hypothetical protein [Planctomycetota bacterium]